MQEDPGLSPGHAASGDREGKEEQQGILRRKSQYGFPSRDRILPDAQKSIQE